MQNRSEELEEGNRQNQATSMWSFCSLSCPGGEVQEESSFHSLRVFMWCFLYINVRTESEDLDMRLEESLLNLQKGEMISEEMLNFNSVMQPLSLPVGSGLWDEASQHESKEKHSRTWSAIHRIHCHFRSLLLDEETQHDVDLPSLWTKKWIYIYSLVLRMKYMYVQVHVHLYNVNRCIPLLKIL